MVRLAVLSSSRADFGVYLPLLKRLESDKRFEVTIIAFGAHTSMLNGFTVGEIYKSTHHKVEELITSVSNDSPEGIASSYSLVLQKFTHYWSYKQEYFDFVLCLGDRFEMQAAVYAGIPYGINFGHFYGGDVTNGAFDNIYRNALTHVSKLHFTSTKKCFDRVCDLLGDDTNVYQVGILSLNNINETDKLNVDDFKKLWSIDLNIPTALITFHPETINFEENKRYATIIKKSLLNLAKDYQLVITLPNADTYGSYFRETYEQVYNDCNNVFLIENFGVQSYFCCLKRSKILIGNTSSGISEAASFRKYFINVGSRQDGREKGDNIIDVDFDDFQIVNAVKKVESLGEFSGENIYYHANSLEIVINNIYRLFGSKV